MALRAAVLPFSLLASVMVGSGGGGPGATPIARPASANEATEPPALAVLRGAEEAEVWMPLLLPPLPLPCPPNAAKARSLKELKELVREEPALPPPVDEEEEAPPLL